MYKPVNSRTLAEAEDPQIRLGIQGYGGTGKSYAALNGFPNPIVVNIDRGLGAHKGRSDVLEVALYDTEVCKKINPNHKDNTNLKDTIMLWLANEATKLEKDQTLVWDGGTGTNNAYHKWYSVNKVVTKTGAYDDYAEYKLKIPFFIDICERFQRLKCNVIYISHESDKKDKQGEYTGKIRPLLSGQFNDQIINYFTDWFRQHSSDKPDFNKLDEKYLKQWDMTRFEFIAMCDTYPRNTIYYWQTESDNIFDGKCSSLINFPRFIPANFESFKKYMRK